METVTKPIIGQAAICEDRDAVIAPGPPDTYLGVAGHLLADISILAKAVPPAGNRTTNALRPCP
jgi:hypothetical protein